MPEERPVIIDPILAQLARMEDHLQAFREEVHAEIKEVRGEMQSLRDEIQSFRYDTHGRLSGLEGKFEQMDKRQGDLTSRLENVESLQRWGLGIMITSWLTLVALTMTILSKLL